jgi:hypothetical protein
VVSTNIKKHKLRNSIKKWYGHILRTKKDRISKKVLNMYLQKNCEKEDED